MNIKNINPWLLILILVLLVVGFYSINFWGAKLSGDTRDWGSFGGYVAGIIGTCLTFFNIFLVIKSINQQKVTSNRQQFENSFFKLIDLHKSAIHNLEFEKKNLYPLKSEGIVFEETLKSTKVLKTFFDLEQPKFFNYFAIQTGYENENDNMFVYNYRALRNHFITSKDFLNIVINNITDIYNFIRKAELDKSEKEFFQRILRNNLADSEKFFLLVFYKQENSTIKDVFTENEIKELIGPKEWMLNLLTINDTFPFCIPGIALGKENSNKRPQNYYLVSVTEFLSKKLYYVVENINPKNKFISLHVLMPRDRYTNHNRYLKNTTEPNANFEIDLSDFFNDFFRSGTKNINEMQPIEFWNAAKGYLDEQNFFYFKIVITVELEGKKYNIHDTISFQIHQETNGGEFKILISSNKNKCEDDNWRHFSFEYYHYNNTRKN